MHSVHITEYISLEKRCIEARMREAWKACSILGRGDTMRFFSLMRGPMCMKKGYNEFALEYSIGVPTVPPIRHAPIFCFGNRSQAQAFGASRTADRYAVLRCRVDEIPRPASSSLVLGIYMLKSPEYIHRFWDDCAAGVVGAAWKHDCEPPPLGTVLASRVIPIEAVLTDWTDGHRVLRR